MIHIRKYHFFFILFHFKIIFTQFYIFERKLRILLIELIAILLFRPFGPFGAIVACFVITEGYHPRL